MLVMGNGLIGRMHFERFHSVAKFYAGRQTGQGGLAAFTAQAHTAGQGVAVCAHGLGRFGPADRGCGRINHRCGSHRRWARGGRWWGRFARCWFGGYAVRCCTRVGGFDKGGRWGVCRGGRRNCYCWGRCRRCWHWCWRLGCWLGHLGDDGVFGSDGGGCATGIKPHPRRDHGHHARHTGPQYPRPPRWCGCPCGGRTKPPGAALSPRRFQPHWLRVVLRHAVLVLK